MVKKGTFWVPSLIYAKLNLDLGWGDEVMQSLYENVRNMLPIAQKAGVWIFVGDDYSGVFRDLVEDDSLDHQVGNYGASLRIMPILKVCPPRTCSAGERKMQVSCWLIRQRR